MAERPNNFTPSKEEYVSIHPTHLMLKTIMLMQFKNILYQKFLLTLCFIGLISQQVSAQILPGDADNNGGVENVDFLYIGYGYGHTGASRIEGSSIPQEQSIQTFWDNSFPTGLNFVFADANGDGIIDYLDFLTVFQNYGVTQSNYTPPIYFEDDNGIPVFFDESDVPAMVTQNTTIELPLFIGDQDGTTESFNGIAFTIEYDPDLITNFELDFSNSWLGTTQDLFQVTRMPEAGKVEVALTKIGNNPSYGNGRIGMASFIIEDDLVAWLATPQDSLETKIKITKVVYKSSGFSTRPTRTEEVNLMLFHPDALLFNPPTLSQKSITIAPNPTRKETVISSDYRIKEIALYDISGKKLLHQKYNQDTVSLHHLERYKDGLYFIHITTEKGSITKKLLIQK